MDVQSPDSYPSESMELPAHTTNLDEKQYTKKLEEKLRDYAKRLQQLETQKMYETVPISLQKSQNFQQKLEKLKSENDSLKMQLARGNFDDPYSISTFQTKIKKLESEKAQVEETLRGEVLANEEQRNYIEMLKEALEAKVADLGLQEFIGKCKGKKSYDIITEIYLTKKEIDKKHREIAEKESKLSTAEHMISIISQKFENAKKEQVREINEITRKFESEISEKHELENSVKLMKEELQKCEAESIQNKENYENCMNELIINKGKYKEACENEEKAKINLENCKKTINELLEKQGKYEVEKENLDKNYKKQIENYEIKIKENEEKLLKNEEILRKMNEEKNNFEKEIKEKSDKIINFEQNLNQLNMKIQENQENYNRLKNSNETEILKLQSELQNNKEKLEQTLKNCENYQNEIYSSNIEKEELNKKIIEIIKDREFKEKRIVECQAEIQRLLQSYANIDEKYKNLVLENDQSVKKCEMENLANYKKNEELKFANERLKLSQETQKIEFDSLIKEKTEECENMHKNLEKLESEFQSNLYFLKYFYSSKESKK